MNSDIFDPKLIANEIKQFNQDLANSIKIINKLPEINIWKTKKIKVFQQDNTQLFHCPGNEGKPPLLICYALVNKVYMIDLDPKHSLLNQLISQGHNVYLIDWGEPDITDRYLDLDDYINHYLYQCSQYVLNHSGSNQLDLLGICQGGTMSLCFAALYPELIRKLITLVTPVDFHAKDNLLTPQCKNIDTNLIAQSTTNISGLLLTQFFNQLQPFNLGPLKSIQISKNCFDTASSLNYLRMERWISDSPDLANKAWQEFVELFFQNNSFMNGNVTINGEHVDLNKIQADIFNIYGLNDHLVPANTAKALRSLIKPENYSEMALNAGHIGIFISTKHLPTLASAIKKFREESV